MHGKLPDLFLMGILFFGVYDLSRLDVEKHQSSLFGSQDYVFVAGEDQNSCDVLFIDGLNTVQV